MTSPNLHPKVASASVAGSVTTLLVVGLTALGVNVPPEVASAAVTVLTFAAGYLAPPKQEVK